MTYKSSVHFVHTEGLNLEEISFKGFLAPMWLLPPVSVSIGLDYSMNQNLVSLTLDQVYIGSQLHGISQKYASKFQEEIMILRSPTRGNKEVIMSKHYCYFYDW